MKILLQIIQFPPDVNSTGLLMARLGEELVARGHEVRVVTTFPHYERFHVPDEYRGRVLERSRYRGMEVLRLPVLTPGSKQRMTNRLVSYLSFNAGATLAGWLSRRPVDVILCTNGSFFTGVTAYLSGAPRHVPFVLNVQDLYPEAFVHAGRLRNRTAIAALERIEGFMYRRAAHVTVITPTFEEHLLAQGVPADKLSVIPNFVDTEFITPLPKDNPEARRLDLAGQFVVCHAGNLGYVYDLDTLLDAAALLREQRDILFLIIGDGAVKPDLERRARELNLPNVRFLPFQPLEALPGLRAACDVHVSLYRNGQGRYSMPSKVYEIMAAARPVLASADPASDITRLIHDVQAGVVVAPSDPARLADAVLTLYRDPGLREEMGRRGRREVEARYTLGVVADRYEQVLGSVIARSAVAKGRRESAPSAVRDVAKRTLDITLAIVGLILSSPLWALAALAIKLEDGGPVWYAQERWGRDGTVFRVHKFRTMATHNHGAVRQADANDGRVTRVGRLLRAMGIDELPQLVNIVRGEMSIVGPRALAVGELVQDGRGHLIDYQSVPGFHRRLVARPGLTSLATLYIPKDALPARKFRYDLVYIRRRSLWLDVRLIMLSLWVSFRGNWESRGSKV